MFETAGTLTIVELASSLAALVLLPLLWATVAAVAALRGAGGRLAVRVAIATSGGTLALAVAHAVRASLLSPGRIAQQHVAHFARIGQLDLAIDLVRSPTSAACAVLAAFVAFAAVLHAVWGPTEHAAGRLAWTGLMTSAVLLVVLADGLPALAVGLQLATLAGWALGGGGRARALGLALAGDTVVVFAAWILFWSLGGSFGTSGYTPDAQPRFALVVAPDPLRADGKSTVALTTYEDARVSSDDGPPLPGEPLRAPFVLTLDPGIYSFRIEAGAAASDLLITHVTLAPGRAYVLSPYGPTTSMRNLGDQLAVPRPSLVGTTPVRTALASRSIAGIPVTSVIALSIVVAALLRLALLARTNRGGLVYALDALPPIVLALHVAPLVDGAVGSSLAVAPAFAAILLAADAASTKIPAQVPRATLAALAAIGVASVLLGETAAAIGILVASTLGAAAATAALDTDSDVRWLGVACASLAGLLPGAGASPAIASAIAGAFGASTTGQWTGVVVAPFLTASVILLSMGLFRVYGASIHAPAAVLRGPRGSDVLVVVLAATSLLGGVALGAGSSQFGGRTAPLARRLVVSPGGLDGAPRVAGAALIVALAATIIGLVAARRASRTSTVPGWVAILGAPTAVTGRIAAGAAALLRFFVRSVDIMNKDVIDDATEAFGACFAAAARALRRLDERLGGLGTRLFGRGADEVVVRTGMDDPRRFERVRLGLVLGMMALLGLVVLSSVVLG